MKKLIVDVMGLDNGPSIAIDASISFQQLYKTSYSIILVGKEKLILKHLPENYKSLNIEVLNADEIITSEDSFMAIKRKPNSSLVKAFKYLVDKNADGLISGAASAPFVVGCHLLVGEIDGLSRPAFMPVIPTLQTDRKLLLLDVGANIEIRPTDLVNFAKLGTIFSKNVFGNKTPKVRLVNIGEEKSKGRDLEKKAFKLLSDDYAVHFRGNVEPRDLLSGETDIAITDGFTGNIVLKTLEGSMLTLNKLLKSEYHKGLIVRKLGALLSSGVFKGFKQKFDYKNSGGAIVIGLKKPVIKSHGSSDTREFLSALILLKKTVDANLTNKLSEVFSPKKSDEENDEGK